MQAFVTVDKNWGMSLKGKPFLTIPEVEGLIRQETKGKQIILSRYAVENLFGGLLPGRDYYVLTRDKDYSAKYINRVNDVEELLKLGDPCVLGGEKIFRTLLPYIDVVEAACLDHIYEADAYFENLDRSEEFELVKESEERTFFDIEYVFRRYERKK